MTPEQQAKVAEIEKLRKRVDYIHCDDADYLIALVREQAAELERRRARDMTVCQQCLKPYDGLAKCDGCNYCPVCCKCGDDE